MPKVHINEDGQTIKWGIVEKVLGGIITSLTVLALTAAIGGWVRLALVETKVQTHEEVLNRGDRYTTKDANSDRQNRAQHEAAVLSALTSIQAQQVEQTRILADLSARMVGVEQEMRDAREERMQIERDVRDIRSP